jgi:hypothetical protein
MKKGGVRAPGRADAQAVRLLTVHGAKGLEADCVLLLDTDTRPQKAETMGVLVDWPGEPPRRAASSFWPANPARRPAPTATLAAEQLARSREELNMLYVAMTRARHCLALSSVEPHRDSGRSPWRRIEPQAQAVEVPGRAAAATPDAPTPRRRLRRDIFHAFCARSQRAKGHKLLSKMKGLKPAPTSRAWARPCTGCWSRRRLGERRQPGCDARRESRTPGLCDPRRARIRAPARRRPPGRHHGPPHPHRRRPLGVGQHGHRLAG